MKTIGIIAEYNPFHEGHGFLIQQAKKLAKADYCIVVMSGCYVQRGTPAIFDQHIRSAMALDGGADLVLELPSWYATGSARRFAQGAVSMLCHLGVVDYLAFGCEDISPQKWNILKSCAHRLVNATDDLQRRTKQYQNQGMSYPMARTHGLYDIVSAGIHMPDKEEFFTTLQQPNSILALEYLRALEESQLQNSPYSTILPLPIQRLGASYHSTTLTGSDFPSASALRKAIFEAKESWRTLLSFYSEDISDLLDFIPGPIGPEVMDPVMGYKLLSETPDHLSTYMDINSALAQRIWQNRDHYQNWSQFISLCKTKETPQTALQRALLHIFLDITQKEYDQANALGFPPFARLLALKKDSHTLTGSMKANSQVPIISKPAQAKKYLMPEIYPLWEKEILRSQWYQSMAARQYHSPITNEYTRPIFMK